MKHFWKTIAYILMTVLSLGAFALIAQYYYTGGSEWYGSDLENSCYILWSLTFLMYFCPLANRLRSTWKQVIAAIATAVTYTAAVFFTNNFWRLLSLNHAFHWESSISYGTVLRWDLSYDVSRYLILFAGMLVLCGAKVFLCHFKIRHLKQAVLNWLQGGSAVSLYPPFTPDEDGKMKLKSLIDEYEWWFYIHLLFNQYGDTLTREEYQTYRQLYVEAIRGLFSQYQAAPPDEITAAACMEPFEALEEKFKIDDEE